MSISSAAQAELSKKYSKIGTILSWFIIFLPRFFLIKLPLLLIIFKACIEAVGEKYLDKY